ncbi:MAG: hypothetical protein U9Q82_08175 [Chloroflexota bacterium]|nr:hypothetical protein [Chloroflexota bacterium]
MKLEHITYLTFLNDDLIAAPNFPAWVCIICGRREYEPRSASRLNKLLNPHPKHTLRPVRNPQHHP